MLVRWRPPRRWCPRCGRRCWPATSSSLSTSPHDDGSLATEWLDGTEALLATYFELEDPTRLEPADRELALSVELDSGLVLRGYVDRLDVAPDGAMRVVDYKTGRAPGVAFQQKAMFQMRFYALALWRQRGEVPRLLQLIYLGDGQVVRYAARRGRPGRHGAQGAGPGRRHRTGG